MMHFWFLCKTCNRKISGCLKSCPCEPKIELVESCAMCAQKEKNA